MDYIILIGVIAVLTISGFYGYKRGFVRIVLSMAAMLVTFALSAILTVPVSAMLAAATPLDESIEESVSGLVEDSGVIDVKSISNLSLPEQIEELLIEGAKNTVNGFQEYIISTVSDLILKAVTFFILIIVIYIIVRIVIYMLDFISKLPVINSINKTGGLVVGIAQGLLLVWIGCLIVTAFSDKAWAQEVFKQINANPLLTFIYNNNLITFIVTKFI